MSERKNELFEAIKSSQIVAEAPYQPGYEDAAFIFRGLNGIFNSIGFDPAPDCCHPFLSSDYLDSTTSERCNLLATHYCDLPSDWPDSLSHDW